MHRTAIAVLIALIIATPVFSQTPRPPRPVRPTSTPAAPERVMVALVFGQSNAANFGQSRRTAGPKVQVLAGNRLIRAADPLPGANGEGGSVWTRLGDKLIAAGRYDRVIFVAAAVGGTEIGEWTPESKKHFRLIESQLRAAQARGLRFTHLLWHQGESDAYLQIHPTDYRQRFGSIMKGIRELGVDAPVFVAVATRCGAYGENKDIRWVQRDMVNHDLRIWQGPDTDVLGPEFRHDGCHFSTDGLNAHADLWLEYLARYDAVRN
jgi:Carbohydrate esterase, sialic acid-specific acetylesterase